MTALRLNVQGAKEGEYEYPRNKEVIVERKYSGKYYKFCSDNGQLKYAHRLAAEKALGKPLPPYAEVHHVNGSKNGGSLVICENRSYHRLLHVRQKALVATGDPKKRKCVRCKGWDDILNLRPHDPREPEVFCHPKCATAHSVKYKQRKRLLARNEK